MRTLLRGFLSPRLLEAGLICRADDRGDPVVQISPPLVAEQAQFDEIVGILGEVLARPGAGPLVRERMRAMVLDSPGTPLRRPSCRRPSPARAGRGRRGRLRRLAVRTSTWSTASCPTQAPPRSRSHQIVGRVVEPGELRRRRAGRHPVARLGRAARPATAGGRENLCDAHASPATTSTVGTPSRRRRRALLLQVPGGYEISGGAPPLCRLDRLPLLETGDAERLGLYGFGASAHRHPGRRHEGRRVRLHRAGDDPGAAFARGSAAGGRATARAGGASMAIFAPPASCRRARGGGGRTVVCAGIHVSDIPSFPYELPGASVWSSVANLAARRRGVPRVGAARARATGWRPR